MITAQGSDVCVLCPTPTPKEVTFNKTPLCGMHYRLIQAKAGTKKQSKTTPQQRTKEIKDKLLKSPKTVLAKSSPKVKDGKEIFVVGEPKELLEEAEVISDEIEEAEARVKKFQEVKESLESKLLNNSGKLEEALKELKQSNADMKYKKFLDDPVLKGKKIAQLGYSDTGSIHVKIDNDWYLSNSAFLQAKHGNPKDFKDKQVLIKIEKWVEKKAKQVYPEVD